MAITPEAPSDDPNTTWPPRRTRAAGCLFAMKVDKLKVRPKKIAASAPCAAEFAAVLACWASSNDIRSQSTCQDPTRVLRDCMATKVRYDVLTQRPPMNRSKPTINYHLARFSKRV